jgi:hypothetical protein
MPAMDGGIGRHVAPAVDPEVEVKDLAKRTSK